MNNTQYAGFWIRFVAVVIDAIILSVVGWVIGQVIQAEIIGMLIGAAYYLYFWVKQKGQTPGKKVMGIRIVRVDGKEIDWMTAVLRYVGYIVSGIPLALGFIWVAFDKQKQGWHDKIAGTFVVKV